MLGAVCRPGRLVPALLLGSVLLPVCQSLAPAQQFFVSGRFELSDSVSLDQADSTTRTHLERVRACLADEQWDEAVETLRQVMANHGSKVIELAEGRYVSVRDYCHLRISAMPAPALDLYRNRVDSQARQWYEQAIASRDRELLLQVVEQLFASSHGDQALYALGEIALEQGDYSAARGYWEKLIETPPAAIAGETFDQARRADGLPADDAKLLDRWYRAIETADDPMYELNSPGIMPDEAVGALVRFWNARGLLPKRLAYPETDLDLADVRARLVLVSILEGSSARAQGELEAFGELHAAATGKIGGRSGSYTDLLSTLLEASQQWPLARAETPWHTFAGNFERNYVDPQSVELGELRWQRDLVRTSVSDSQAPRSFGFRPRRVAEDQDGLLSYHPLVVGDLVFVADANRIWALDLATGEPAWGLDKPIFSDEDPAQVRPHTRHGSLGAPRFTLTSFGNKLFARVGSPVTSTSVDSPFSNSSGMLVCLDIAAQGRLLWQIAPDDDKWAFEGPPVCDGEDIYVAMRRSDIRPQAHVACFDAETGKQRWRRFVCSAETPGRGQMDEITHNLLTLHRDTLYFNTNLGAVAALSTTDGEFRWVTLYPRAEGGNLNQHSAHFYRDLNPCLYDRGRLFVAPSDSERVFALSAQTGELLWRTAPGHPDDAVHLLGVSGDKLVASGDRLWWFSAESGKSLAYWPDSASGPPKGYGRGLLAGDEVIWPTREKLIRFNQATRQRVGEEGLKERSLTGGNLVLAGDCLLIATGDKLYAFENYGYSQPGHSDPGKE